MDKKKIIAVVGPTASGKSALALELARQYDGEIVSCDSMQIYKKMNIGTAKPTADELLAVRHHMIDIAEPTDNFSCEDYVRQASVAIDDICKRGKLPIVCGGTGLYLDALLRKNDFETMSADESLRAELAEFAEKNGAEALWEELFRVDPESAKATHPNNVKRVIRALEIYRLSGLTKTELDRRSREGGFRYDACVIGLRYGERELLYRRIDRRVDQMLEMGLLAETEALAREGVFEKNRTAAQAIGYKEMVGVVLKGDDLKEATEALKQATRNYAKRQLTWFRHMDGAFTVYVDCPDGSPRKKEDILSECKSIFTNGIK